MEGALVRARLFTPSQMWSSCDEILKVQKAKMGSQKKNSQYNCPNATNCIDFRDCWGEGGGRTAGRWGGADSRQTDTRAAKPRTCKITLFVVPSTHEFSSKPSNSFHGINSVLLFVVQSSIVALLYFCGLKVCPPLQPLIGFAV